LKYLCREYNKNQENPETRIATAELWWGWVEVKDFNDFGDLGSGRLAKVSCLP
jgi:hypothetical protein